MAEPLTVSSSLPQNLIEIIRQSNTRWLEPPDVAQLLHAGSLARELSLVCTEPALQPAGMDQVWLCALLRAGAARPLHGCHPAIYLGYLLPA